jgi:hypothetical protein
MKRGKGNVRSFPEGVQSGSATKSGGRVVTFQQAYEAAAARFAPEDWADLRPDLRINEIYEEMRRLDAEAAARKS